MTYQVNKGVQITKDRVTEVSNPRTNGQMVQRARFAAAVKFYKRATANFFKFAFEDKKQQESDYNAFMRYNAKLGSIVSKENNDNPFYPAVGPFVMSNGSLPTIPVVYSGSSSTPTEDFFLPFNIADNETIGGFSAAILASNAAFLAGDIVTIVLVTTRLNDVWEMADDNYPVWDIAQFRLDPTSTEDIASLNTRSLQLSASGSYVKINDTDETTGYVSGACCIVSRNIPGGLLVSYSQMLPNLTGVNYINYLATPAVEEANLVSWGSQGAAILQGSIADKHKAPEVKPVFTGFKGTATNLVDANDSTLTEKGAPLAATYETDANNYVVLVGTNLDMISEAKISITPSTVTLTGVGKDPVIGTYIVLKVPDLLTEDIFVSYDGVDLFEING